MPARQPGRVTVENNVTFGSGGGRALNADLYMPPEPGTGRGAVVLVHGGGWINGDRSQLAYYPSRRRCRCTRQLSELAVLFLERKVGAAR